MTDETRIPYRAPQAQRAIDLFAIQQTKTYSLTVGHVVRVTELAHLLKMKDGAVLRKAIDLLYESLVEDAVSVSRSKNTTDLNSVKRNKAIYR